jgi:Fe-S-cluster containining protein
VVLRFSEWLNLVRSYGIGVTRTNLQNFSIQKKRDGSCFFSYFFNGRWSCGLQNMKPMACKLWPFKIVGRPKYGRSNEAFFSHNKEKFFVYIDSFCPEIKWGPPTDNISKKLIPEFIEIALGKKKKQKYSTSPNWNNFFPNEI